MSFVHWYTEETKLRAVYDVSFCGSWLKSEIYDLTCIKDANMSKLAIYFVFIVDIQKIRWIVLLLCFARMPFFMICIYSSICIPYRLFQRVHTSSKNVNMSNVSTYIRSVLIFFFAGQLSSLCDMDTTMRYVLISVLCSTSI